MGKMKSAMRKLDPVRVQMAQKVQAAKHELAMKMVAERVKTDADFAADVLKVAGEGLRPEIRKDAEETIERLKANMERAGGIGNAVGLAVLNNDGKLPEALLPSPERMKEAATEFCAENAAELLKASNPSNEQCGGEGCLCQNH